MYQDNIKQNKWTGVFTHVALGGDPVRGTVEQWQQGLPGVHLRPSISSTTVSGGVNRRKMEQFC